MSEKNIHAVTGAYGYSGRYLATRMLAQGRPVITLTNSLHRANPFAGRIPAFPLSFDRPDRLAALAGVDVLYNTYWVRFNHRRFTHAQAVDNTLRLLVAAKQAGVRRIVHVSITNPSENSPLEYFSGKARLERALQESGLSYAILRPTVLFGREDILINNIAWALRRFPCFALFGDGSYRLQPVCVEDLAELAVTAGQGTDNVVLNAIGPETFTYRELVTAVGTAIGRPRPLVNVPPAAGWASRRPPPPAIALIMIAPPAPSAARKAVASARVVARSVPSTIGTPCAPAKRRACALSPNRSSTSGCGPTKMIPASAQPRAKPAFSLMKP